MDDPGMDIETLTARMQGCLPHSQDEEHLRLLTLGFYIVGGVTIAFASVFIAHFVIGLTLIAHPDTFPPSPGSGPMPPEMGYMFATMGGLVVFGGWILGGLNLYAAWRLKSRQNYVFLMVMAGLDCLLLTPLGTVLGIFTFVVLSRPTVRALFEPSTGL